MRRGARTARVAKRSRRVSRKSARKSARKVRKSARKVRVSKRSSKPARRSRKGRKGKKAASPWNKHLMSVFREMKQKDSNIKLGDAMKVAKKSYRKA